MDKCQAEVQRGTRWVRCPNDATDTHHRLTTARGGRNLDRVGETYHIIRLCRECHMLCDGADAYEGGMLLRGSVTWNKILNRPQYTGPDPYLSSKYPTRTGSTHTDG